MNTYSIIELHKCQEDCPNWDNCDEDEDNCIYKDVYLHNQLNIWKEMSYNKYVDTILTFNWSEYSDGETF